MIECKDVDYILAIARCQSISAAAAELFISQPALTKYLQSLEARVGVVLFNRSHRKLLPTMAGERYISYAAEIAGVKQQMESELFRFRSEEHEHLRIAFSCVYMRNTLFDAIATLRQNDPALQTEFRELTSPEIEQQLVDHKLDLGFITLPCTHPEIQTELLSEENVLLAVPAENPGCALAKSVKSSPYLWINLGCFKNDPFVLRNPGTRFRALTDHLLEQIDMTPKIIVATRNHFTSIEIAEVQRALCFLPESFAPIIRASKDIRLFITGSPPMKLPAGAAYRKGAPLTRPALRLLRIIRETTHSVSGA